MITNANTMFDYTLTIGYFVQDTKMRLTKHEIEVGLLLNLP